MPGKTIGQVTSTSEEEDVSKSAILAGGSNRPANEAAGESQPEAYPQGYVEDCDEPRTKLGAFS